MSKDKNKNFEMKKRLLNFIAKIDDSQNIEQILFDLKESLNEFKPKHKKLFKKLGELKTRCENNYGEANISKDELKFLNSKAIEKYKVRYLDLGHGLGVKLADEDLRICGVIDKYNIINTIEKISEADNSKITKVGIKSSKDYKDLRYICNMLRERHSDTYSYEEMALSLFGNAKRRINMKELDFPYDVSVDVFVDDGKIVVNDPFHIIELYDQVYMESLNDSEKYQDYFEKE